MKYKLGLLQREIHQLAINLAKGCDMTKNGHKMEVGNSPLFSLATGVCVGGGGGGGEDVHVHVYM